jgi:excisionase family DNA binding protein
MKSKNSKLEIAPVSHARRTSDAQLAPNGPFLLTLPELAAHLRIDRATVYRLLQRHELPIPVLRLGRSPRVRASDVENYLAELAAEEQQPRPIRPQVANGR